MARRADAGGGLGINRSDHSFVPRCSGLIPPGCHGRNPYIDSNSGPSDTHANTERHSQPDPIPDSYLDACGHAHKCPDLHAHAIGAHSHADRHTDAIPDRASRGDVNSADARVRSAEATARRRDPDKLDKQDVDRPCTTATGQST
jgi:hypothetical protein